MRPTTISPRPSYRLTVREQAAQRIRQASKEERAAALARLMVSGRLPASRVVRGGYREVMGL